MKMLSSALLALFVMTGAAADDAIREGLDRTRAAGEEKLEKARAAVLKSFERKEEAARKAGNKRALDRIKEERSDFESAGFIPTVVPSQEYFRQERKTLSEIDRAYSAALKSYTKAGKNTEASALEREWTELNRTLHHTLLKQPMMADLFNSKNLTGWHPSGGSKAEWTVTDGVLVGTGPQGYLISDRGGLANFHVRAEVNINDGSNSGLFFRASADEGATGYEAQINSSGADPRKTGSLFAGTRPFKVLTVAPQSPALPGRWFTLDVIASGELIKIAVDGQLITRYVDTDRHFSKGNIALQQSGPGNVVKFRRVQLRELP